MIVLNLQVSDWLGLLLYFLSMSLLAVGGAISLAPDMHRFLVDQQGWLTDLQFNASIAIAQAAPGPNLLFIALLGWNVGLNAAGAGTGSAGWALGLLGAGLTMLGILLPSATLTWLATRWAQRNRQRRSVRAFKQGMAPIVIGFMMATAWVLGRGQGQVQADAGLWMLGLVCALLVWRTRLHLLWLLGAGALLGALGWV
ncbi:MULTISPECIES: chromate transporter [Giesbergeria]|uniref:Chromate transporter n=1 Tax=Giesbergeria sinuosa TaxID=80883 RepID=A0ABV9Q9A8_9BURK